VEVTTRKSWRKGNWRGRGRGQRPAPGRTPGALLSKPCHTHTHAHKHKHRRHTSTQAHSRQAHTVVREEDGANALTTFLAPGRTPGALRSSPIARPATRTHTHTKHLNFEFTCWPLVMVLTKSSLRNNLRSNSSLQN
jgi:hypothetical protein